MVEDSTKRTEEELSVWKETDGSKQQNVVNRKYKDTIFRKLFHKKKELFLTCR